MFGGRALWIKGFAETLLGLALLDRSVTDFLSTWFVEPIVERRPIDALVGDVDLLELATNALLVVPTAARFDPSSAASSDSTFLFVIELSEGLAFKFDFVKEAALPVVAARREIGSLTPPFGVPRWLEDIAVVESRAGKGNKR